MKRLICALIAVILLVPAALAEGDLTIEEIVEEIDLDATVYGDTVWDFPVALEDMEPDFVVLANKHYLLDSKFVCKPLVKIKSMSLNKDGTKKKGDMYVVSKGMELNETCAQALIALADGARADGYNLYLKSAYRSYQTQKTMYYNRLKKNNGKDDGWVSMPGASDHQTGLGCDVVPRSWRDKAMNGKMGKEPECIWMAEHCQEYGFILRYPPDKEDVTEINYEPWHLRYVGIPAATYIMENGLCLEEFNEQLQAAIKKFLEDGGDPQMVNAYIQEPAEQ
jgi:D-alanyl-D-alanine carboxypeptidase